MAASMWKIWAEGDEVYAMNRAMGGIAKISVHFSGQIHTTLGSKREQHARMMPIAGGQWRHALQWRFLLSQDALRPLPERLKKHDKAYTIEVPAGGMLLLDLIIAESPNTNPETLPAMFDGQQARAAWTARLRAGHPVALVLRVMLQMDAENVERLRYIRFERTPHATFKTKPARHYLEVRNTEWSDGGNVLFIVPMGIEALRVDPS